MMNSNIEVKRNIGLHFNRKYQPNEETKEIQNILVIEDDIALQTVIKRVLQMLNPKIDIIWASSVKEAQRALFQQIHAKGKAPIFILTDMYLPHFELGTRIWKQCQKECPDVPFAFMSSMGIDEYLKAFPQQETLPPFLPKPFTVSQCKNMLKRLLHLYR